MFSPESHTSTALWTRGFENGANFSSDVISISQQAQEICRYASFLIASNPIGPGLNTLLTDMGSNSDPSAAI